MKINNSSDKDIIHNYFKLIWIDKNKQFNLEKLFKEIYFLFNKELRLDIKDDNIINNIMKYF